MEVLLTSVLEHIRWISMRRTLSVALTPFSLIHLYTTSGAVLVNVPLPVSEVDDLH